MCSEKLRLGMVAFGILAASPIMIMGLLVDLDGLRVVNREGVPAVGNTGEMEQVAGLDIFMGYSCAKKTKQGVHSRRQLGGDQNFTMRSCAVFSASEYPVHQVGGARYQEDTHEEG